MKSGTIAIVGRPNVGKSTLLNALLTEKVSIVSNKPQTTRTRIVGVVHRPTAQLVYLDTPGLHRPSHLLNQRMVRLARDTIREADLLYVMVEGTHAPGASERWLIDQIRPILLEDHTPVFLLLSKVDLVKKPKLLPLLEAYGSLLPWTEVIPLSAKVSINLDRLLDVTEAHLSEGHPVYDEDYLTDQSLRTLASETIREKILHETSKEVPHAVAVEIEQFDESRKVVHIGAAIYVERETQKPIIVGKRGDRLKVIGMAARVELEQLLGRKVYLELWVKVKNAWRENKDILLDLGY